MGIEWIILYLGLSVLAGIAAARKGRSGIGFFLLALVLSPIIGLLAAVIARPAAAREQALVRAGYHSKIWRKCPSCAEIVRREARLCRHCGQALPAKATHRKDPTLRELLQAEQSGTDSGKSAPPWR